MLGLVLEGGGAKGAYQIGSYFALKEQGYKFEAIAGTSIGAINGALIAMGDAKLAMEVWQNSNLSDYYDAANIPKNDFGANNPLAFLHLKKFIDNINSKRIPLDPLKNFVHKYIDEDKVRASKIKFGLVTVNITDMVVEEKFIDEIPKGQLCDYIIASCYLPIFKRELINGKVYLDGGFANQIPYNMVQRFGLRPVIIRANPNDIKNLTMPDNAIVIAPNIKYVETMDFNPNKSDELMRIGYFDTYKKLKGYLGKKYYVKAFEESKANKILQDLYFEKVKNLNRYELNSEYRKFYEYFIPELAQKLKCGSKFTYAEVLVGIFEYYAKKEDLEYLKVYEFDEVVKYLKEQSNLETLTDELENPFNIKSLVGKVLG